MFDKSIIIGMASDHAGFELKEYIKGLLLANGYKVKDYGTHSEESVDYPDFAHPLASDISGNRLQTGILICGTGNGISMTANKHDNVRCALCWDPEIARLARQHNDANILALPGRFISKDKGAEFQSLEQVEARHKAMRYGVNKFFYFLYRWYTMLQVKATPVLQRMLRSLRERYGDDIPEDIRLDFRKRSRALMRYIDLLTFNGRTIVMFVIVLTGQVWAYFLYEILVLNIVLVFVSRRHERMCSAFVDR